MLRPTLLRLPLAARLTASAPRMILPAPNKLFHCNYQNLTIDMKTTLPKLVVVALCIAAPFRPGSMLAQAPPGQPPVAAPTAPLLSPDQLQNLVGRIALYPDDLLGLMLPAATTPLDIVKGQHFLEKYKQDKTLKPDPSLSQPVLSLLAYPEVVSFMSDDLDWTQALGQAVIAQQPDLLQAIQIFRRKAQDAGNLKTDDKQVVVDQQDGVKIVPAKQEVVYVPQYQPSAAVVQQTAAPAVTYSSTAYPNYYVPGAAAAAATTGYVAGAATAYGMNWAAGAVYSAPYAAQSSYNQQQRQNYATQSQQSWQNYSNSAQTQRQNAASQNQGARQQTSTTNQAQRQQSASGAQSQAGANQGQRQQSLSGAQSQAGANQAQRQGAAGAQQGQRQAPEGAQHWQGSSPAGRQGGQTQAARSASAGQFGGRQAGSGSGALGGMSSGSRSQSFSKRGGQSMSSMSHGGGGRHR